jgi:hypothetical protein
MLVQFVDPVVAIQCQEFPDDKLALRSQSTVMKAHKGFKFFRRFLVHFSLYCNRIAIAET